MGMWDPAYPTGNLRWITRDGVKVLQQEWTVPFSDYDRKVEWRDVETV